MSDNKKTQFAADFLPACMDDARANGWQEVDFVLVCGDAYVDHPSFGAALLGRVLTAQGWRVGMLPQPNFTTEEGFKEYGRPRLGFLISGGVVDSMVAHYTVAKRRRTFDEYTPGGKTGKRPDRVVEAYTRLAKAAYPDAPVIIGGVEASLRRFAHYDYWEDSVRPSILETSGADLISFGMGENSLSEIAKRLDAGEKISEIRNVAGTAYMADFADLPQKYVECASFAKVKNDKTAYAKACALQMDNQDSMASRPVVQKQSEKYLVQNLPAMPLNRQQLDEVYALPFTRRWHPMYDAAGGVPALEEVEFSIIHNRGCFGGCNFCAITLHQGRRVTSRSAESVVKEGEALAKTQGFKGYIHDVGGPTANFRAASCQKQAKSGVCGGGKRCLAPSPCPNLQVSHTEYLEILRKLRGIPGVKKVFIRSGIRYDYLIHDKDESFFKELVQHHVSGQLKVAPEHCAPAVLSAMGKPPIGTYNRFAKRFYELSANAGKEQYLVPYLMSSHPGSRLCDAVALAEYLADNKIRPEQVQDFYPTPGTVSTCMYYTGLEPYTLKHIYVARTPQEKAAQRALLQYHMPKNAAAVQKALVQCGRQDLFPKLLGKPAPRAQAQKSGDANRSGKNSKNRGSRGNAKNADGRKPAQKGGESRGKNKRGRKQGGKTEGRARRG